MRLATFNVENLFARARALNLADPNESRPILEKYSELNQLFEEPVYSDDMKARMLALLGELGIGKTNDKKAVLSLPYQGANNAHVLEAAIRAKFKTGNPRLSSIFED